MHRKTERDESQRVRRSFLLRARDVAHMLDCSPDDIYALIHNGELIAKRKGRFCKFRPQDVVDYMKRKTRRLTYGKTIVAQEAGSRFISPSKGEGNMTQPSTQV